MKKILFPFLILLGVFILGATTVFLYIKLTFYPPEVLDYRPQNFEVAINHQFFYSVGDQLKYTTTETFDLNDPTLWSGPIQQVYASPDNQKALVVSDGELFLISASGELKELITKVDSLHQEPKPLGKVYYRDDSIQWAPDSHSFYLIKDQFYETQGIQLFSTKARLVNYNLQSKQFTEVIHPFPAYEYFLSNDGKRIFFMESVASGDLELTSWYQRTTEAVEVVDKEQFVWRIGEKEIKIEPFYAFDRPDYDVSHNAIDNISMRYIDLDQFIQGIYHLDKGQEKLLIRIKEGLSGKGHYSGINLIHKNLFLPGKRYFLLNIYSKNSSGQLLFDVVQNTYKELPQNTRVYLNMSLADISEEQRQAMFWSKFTPTSLTQDVSFKKINQP